MLHYTSDAQKRFRNFKPNQFEGNSLHKFDVNSEKSVRFSMKKLRYDEKIAPTDEAPIAGFELPSFGLVNKNAIYTTVEACEL